MKKHFLLSLIILFSVAVLEAAPKKIKYGKYTEYIGAVSNKTPTGDGSMTIFSRINKKEPLLVIKGIFSIKPDMGIIVSNAELSINNGLSFTTSLLNIDISKTKDAESISLQMPDCEIMDSENKVFNDEPFAINLEWVKNKQNNEWKFNMPNNGIGYITSNFWPVNSVNEQVKSLKINPIKQELTYNILHRTEPLNLPFKIELTKVRKIYFDSGLNVDLGNKTTYSFPNGNEIEYNAAGGISKLSMNFDDGFMSSDGNKLTLNFKNGDKYEAKPSSGLFLPLNAYPQVQSLKELNLKDGVYHHSNENISDTYKGGEIVERSFPDGTISLGNGSQYVIKFNNGNIFSGTNKHFIQNPDDFLKFKNASDAILNIGKLTKTNQEWDYYENGIVTGGQWPLSDGGYVKYIDNAIVMLTYPDGKYTYYATFEKDLPYSPSLKTSDYVIKDGTISSPTGESMTFKNGQVVPKNYEDIKFITESKGLQMKKIQIHHEYCNFSILEGDNDDNTIKITSRDNVKQLNNTDFYINIIPGYRFTWPKSHIIKGYNRGGDYPVIQAQSIKFNYVPYFSDDPNWPGDVRHYLVWVYKPVSEKNGVTYAQTKGVYVMNKDDTIVYDLSETFDKGHNKSFKEVRPAPKKKTYHKNGRVENCGICLGTGMGWQGGYCPFCGGKGWYIEHEW